MDIQTEDWFCPILTPSGDQMRKVRPIMTLEMALFEGAKWHKSTRSGLGNCVEVTTAVVDGRVGVRHTLDRGGVVLAFSAPVWSEFVGSIKAGEMCGTGPSARIGI